MKILITGTAGFIGFHLAKRLLERNHEIIGVDNINDYYDVNLKYARLLESGISSRCSTWYKFIQSKKYPKYRFIRMNLEDREKIIQLFKNEKFDKVCNLAAQAGVRYSLVNPYAYIESNILGFINILEACKQSNIQHLIYASSSSVYGNTTKMPLKVTDNVDNPISLYAASKKSNELMAHVYSHLFKIPITGLRFFTVYGPWGRPDMALFLFTKAILENKPITVFNYGDMYRDFTYIDDVVEGVVKVIEKDPKIEESIPYFLYNIGNSSPVKLTDFIEIIEKNLGKTATKKQLPMQPGDVYKTFADVSQLRKDYNYNPNTPVGIGVKHFVNWYLKYVN